MKIPNKFILGGQEITVIHTDQIEGGGMGDCCIWDSTIKIADNYKGRPQSDGSKVNTFYHELTHLILDTMGEYELSTNEKFISTFSSFLTGALKTFDYGSD